MAAQPDGQENPTFLPKQIQKPYYVITPNISSKVGLVHTKLGKNGVLRLLYTSKHLNQNICQKEAAQDPKTAIRLVAYPTSPFHMDQLPPWW